MCSESAVYLDRELRKLKPAESYRLARILRVQDSWKKLMAIVPKDDDSDVARFNVEHISMMEQAAAQRQGNAVEIFLSEWATMGKKRPTLRFLLSLLTKAQLFRAADYVAAELLNEKLPKRPEFGPAAPVDISEEMDRVSLKDNEKLANLDYNESLTFGSASRVVDNETIDPNAATSNDDSFEEGNMQSTRRLISSSRGERNCKERSSENDEETSSNVRQTYDPMKFNNGKGNNGVEEEEGGKQTLDQREMPSDELPVFLNEFERSVGQTSKFHREVSSEELPVFLNDSSGTTWSNVETSSDYETNDLSNCKTNDPSNRKANDLSNRNIDRNEMTFTELPRCIVEFRANDVFDSSEDDANVAACLPTELPITVLECNERWTS